MPQEQLVLSGEIYWAYGLFVKDTKYADAGTTDGSYHARLAMDEESFERFTASDSGLTAKAHPDTGKPTITVRRPHNGAFEAAGGPPTVLHEDGETEWGEEDARIGNGTKVTCIMDVYPSMKGTGTRLVAVRVDDLVEFVPAEGPDKVMDKKFAFG